MTQTNKKSDRKTILVGMTGRIDSTVAAYLLKKQGHNVIGIGILFHEVETKLPVDPKTGKKIEPFGVHFISDLERVKGVCDELEIPFYGVHAEDKYQAMVEDFIVAARLGGTTFSPRVNSTSLIIQTLVEKIPALKADYVATGNYAKISHHPTTGAVILSQSNDLANDETFQMAKVDPNDARYLTLPLAEMRRKEVLKIYDSLKLTNYVSQAEIKGDKLDDTLVMEDPRIEELVEKMSSEDVRKEGSILGYLDDELICEHEGIHKFYIGKKKIKTKAGINIDQKLQVVAIDPQRGNIFLCPSDDLKFSFCELNKFSVGKGKDTSIPLNAFVKFKPNLLKVQCDVYIGNNDSAVLQFKETHEGQLIQGQYVVIYDREGEGAKVIGAGVVNRSGYIDSKGERRELPETTLEKSEFDDEAVPPKRSTFKF